MVIRMILRFLANNENLIEKLSDSKPIRRAAQFCVYAFHKSNNLRQTYRLSENPQELAKQIKSIVNRFSSNVKKELEDAKRGLQEKKPK